MSERTPHSDGDVERDDGARNNNSGSSSAEQAETREREMEESGEENAA